MATSETPAPADKELHCPACGYDLRASVEGLCPECGGRFNLANLTRSIPWTGPEPFFRRLTSTLRLVLFNPLQLWQYTGTPIDDRDARWFLVIVNLPLLLALALIGANSETLENGMFSTVKNLLGRMASPISSQSNDLDLIVAFVEFFRAGFVPAFALFIWLFPRCLVTPFVLVRRTDPAYARAIRTATLTRYLSPGVYLLVLSIAGIYWSGFSPTKWSIPYDMFARRFAIVCVSSILLFRGFYLVCVCPFIFMRKAGVSLVGIFGGVMLLTFHWAFCITLSLLVCVFLPSYLIFTWKMLTY